MATTPDPHPDSSPAGPAEVPDGITPIEEPGREGVEAPSPVEDPGSPGGTNHENDTP